MLTVDKGSISINGVSLTIVKSEKDQFSVAIIPYTFENTTFIQTDFSGAEVYAHRGSVSGTNFSETDLTGVDFSHVLAFVVWPQTSPMFGRKWAESTSENK